MAKQTTRDAALSRLFGNPSNPETGEPLEAESKATSSDDEAGGLSNEEALSTEKPKKERRRRKSRGAVEEKTTEPEPSKEESPPSGYIGLGRYSRADGIVERITPYVRPDQAEALRIAVARKNDPRGTDVSQIVQALLDEAGYCG
jgi:hypothetical protein